MSEQERVVNGRIETILYPTDERNAMRVDGERDVLMVESSGGSIVPQSFAFPLDFYLRKQIITRDQWVAGTKLGFCWWRECGASPYVQFRYREGNGGARDTQFVPAGAFATRYRDAMAAIRNVAHRRIAYDVCCEGIPLRLSRRFKSERTAQRRGMPMLLDALDDLDRHFLRNRVDFDIDF